MNPTVYPSGKEIFLNRIPCGGEIQNGEINLFLIKIESNDLYGARIFMGTLQADDVFAPSPMLEFEGERYVLALIPAGDAGVKELSPDTVRERWNTLLKRLLRTSMAEAASECGGDPSSADFIAWTRRRRTNMLKQEARSARFAASALDDKIAALGNIADFTASKASKERDAFAAALVELAAFYHLSFDVEQVNPEITAPEARLKDFTSKSNWRCREVDLTGDYFRQTAAPLLAFTEAHHDPVVLYLASGKSYYKMGGAGEKKIFLNAGNAGLLSSRAFCFYEQFPDGCRSIRELLPFIFRHARDVLFMIALIGLLSSLISFVMPVATRYITETIIPTANMSELWQLMALLFVLTTSSIAAGMVPSLLMLLFGTQQYERFQGAVFDLVLRIPVNVFKECDTGDMTQRILGANQIQSVFFNTITQQFTNSLFSIVSLFMMFYYSVKLGFIGLIMVIVYAGIFFLLSRINLKPLAAQIARSGRLSGFMQQLFNGIAKVRASGAEERLLSRFFDDFADMQKQGYIIARNGAIQSSFSTMFPMFISVVFYALAGGMSGENLALPVFLAFMSAFQSFQSGLLRLSGGLWSLLAVKPEMERLNLILKQTPENSEQRCYPGKLDGKIEVSHLKFRYRNDGPLVLNDLSFTVNPGEFVAIVGPSGAGKSSLIRLLLGFEHPEAGGICYSGKDINTLDLRAVRRQMGVIMQNGKIMPGSILDNIITGTDFTAKDAWNALEMASFADEVEAMPMGIHTLVTSDTISGGQQQRLLIARALVGNPPIVIMDEATSALDNIAQETVKNNLERMKTTRIVIAHRLSTIAGADRIYVLDRGRVVQTGVYAALASRPGLFQDLIRKQLTNPESNL